ncbi:cytochrome P450 [Sistotremastrum suecicum HHB10207 ss-3]|uniref:Cytochrome P450 n=1 Tax=Sistotremastrum suecicum HHB10207 ss-3 TaxID=1314776 RepID=A0A166A042_9AGAM|nr:cytochrome P450 [Sistotremastrum suecicum HHB10207 ss-3]
MALAPTWIFANGLSLDRAMLASGFLLVGIVASLVLIGVRRPSILPPPGPRGSPYSLRRRSIVMGRKHRWKQYAEWTEIYGPVFSLKSNRLNIVVLNSAKAIHDLLGTRSKIYSDRPSSATNDLTTLSKSLVRMSSQGPHFHTTRRIAHEELSAKGTARHLPSIEGDVKLLLKNLLSDPKHFEQHLRLCQSRSVLKTIYGYTVESDDDYLVTRIEDWMKVYNSTMHPGTWLVDSYPILKYYPSWLPGGGFQTFMSKRRASTEEVRNLPFEWAKSEIKSGKSYPSFVLNQMSRENIIPEHEEIVKNVAGTMYMAGVDTVVSTMLIFFLLMTLNPDAQKRAQDEISSVVGSDRLPQLSDRERLPYVDALIQEVFRFHPGGPLGVPHSVTQDDYYEGMFIEKGSTIVSNIWAVTHDESTYPEPMKFDPSRYLRQGEKDAKSIQPDPRSFVFGFGRRVCAGMYFAEVTLFLQISSILATFDTLKEKDADGVEITPQLDFTPGIVSRPEVFVCKIVPRSDAAIDLIMWGQ